MRDCKYGGKCIDPGNPSDCELNSGCFNFKSIEDKSKFDALPDKFLLELENDEIRFKNRTQVKFFLTDFPSWHESTIYVMYEKDRKIKVDIKEFL